ncbi:MAG: hypothetical protein HOV94_12050, partial [Saccharothrix sp.]|nr:hypothetical protein [Saccharothrix sp.]
DVLDLGGGWPAARTATEVADAVTAVVAHARSAFGRVPRVLVEPGKYLVEPAMGVLTTVLDVREGPAGRAAVVDASIAELPDWSTHVHPVLWRSRARGAPWRRLGPGGDSVYGRLCMEHDVPRADVALPDDIEEGDRLLFLDAGAYDASMSYRFGV